MIEEVYILSLYLAPPNKHSHAKRKLVTVTQLGKSLLGVVRCASLLGLGELSSLGLLSLVVCGALGFSSFLESCNNVLVLPADLVRQTTDGAELSARLQSQDPQCLWDNHSLLLVIWWWDTFENLQSLHGSGTSGGFVRDHASDGLVENSGWGSEVEWTASSRIVSSDLS